MTRINTNNVTNAMLAQPAVREALEAARLADIRAAREAAPVAAAPAPVVDDGPEIDFLAMLAEI